MLNPFNSKLSFPLLILLCSVAGFTYTITLKEYIIAICCGVLVLLSLHRLYVQYNKFNQNIFLLLNALDNGDYTFRFSEHKKKKREKELNQILNRISGIVLQARTEAIENERFLSLVVESVPTGIVILDNQNNVHTVNQAALHLLSLPVFTHLNQLTKINPDLPKELIDLKVGMPIQINVSNERESLLVSINMSSIQSSKGMLKVYTLNNIGNELEAKEMESWIRLIRVMTHEIMNSIAPISSLSETLLSVYHSQECVSTNNSLYKNTVEAFETIHSTTKGLLVFVESYRRFSAIPKPEFRIVNLCSLIERVLLLESSNFKKNTIKVSLSCPEGEFILGIDEGQITQVLVNILRNAEQALVQKEDPCIEIRLSQFEGKNIIVDISNNGDPIDERVVPNIFIPFFTTKTSGSGIGLSLSRYIMRLHGGNLKHHTTPEGKTVFSLIFN